MARVRSGLGDVGHCATPPVNLVSGLWWEAVRGLVCDSGALGWGWGWDWNKQKRAPGRGTLQPFLSDSVYPDQTSAGWCNTKGLAVPA